MRGRIFRYFSPPPNSFAHRPPQRIVHITRVNIFGMYINLFFFKYSSTEYYARKIDKGEAKKKKKKVMIYCVRIHR